MSADTYVTSPSIVGVVVECGEADLSWQAGTDYVDVVRVNARFDYQFIVDRHDIHQRLPNPMTPPGVTSRRSVTTPSCGEMI